MATVDVELDELWARFHGALNMTSPELRDWLAASQDVLGGYLEVPDADLPALGQEVVRILGKRKMDVTDDDRAVMRQVADVVEERLANRPPGRAANDDWRHSLMMVGHDPLRPASPHTGKTE
jgi:Protein of unknown function (DUF3140)